MCALSGFSFAGAENLLLRLASDGAARRGAILVAAVGNDGLRGAARYPAGYETVVAVTAVDDRRRIYRAANRGDYVDIAAPGVALPVASAGGVSTASGTSFAAPFVVAALAIEYDAEGRAGRARRSVLNRALDLGPRGRDQSYGEGLLRFDPSLCRR